MGEPDGEWQLSLPPKPAPGAGVSTMSDDGMLVLFDGRLAGRMEPYHLLDARTGSIYRSFAGNFAARSADLTRDGRLVVVQRVGSKKQSGAAVVIAVATGTVVAVIPAPASATSIVPSFVPDGSAVVALVATKPGAAQSIIRYDLAPGAPRPAIVPKSSGGSTWTVQLSESRGVHHLHVDPASNRVLLAGSQGGFTALEFDRGRPADEIPELEKAGAAGFFHLRDGRFGTTNANMDRIRLWNASTGKTVGTIAVREIPPGAGNARFARVFLSPNGKFLVVARSGIPVSDNPEVPFQVFDAATNQLLFATTWRGGSAHFTRDSDRLLVAEWSGRFRWFKLPTGENAGGWDLGPAPPGRRHVVYGLSADGSTIAYNGPAGTKDGSSVPAVLDGKSGGLTRRFNESFAASQLSISDDGQRVALIRDVTLEDCTLEVADVGTGQMLKSVKVASGPRLPTYALAPDGSALVVFNPSDRKLHSYALPPRPTGPKSP